VTGFSNTEEKEVGLDTHVPFLTEDELKARGATYEKASENWAVFVLSDNRVITGQNPASGGAVAEKVLQVLKA
jgi:putative intracellular protease/amidase